MNVVNVQLILVCRQEEDTELDDINNKYFDLDLINSLEVLTRIINMQSRTRASKALEKEKKVLQEQVAKEKTYPVPQIAKHEDYINISEKKVQVSDQNKEVSCMKDLNSSSQVTKKNSNTTKEVIMTD